MCGLTQKPCAYAVDCAWNEEQQQTVRLQRGKSEGEHVGKRQGAAAGAGGQDKLDGAGRPGRGTGEKDGSVGSGADAAHEGVA
ncbi:MAG: hypothetical protein ILO10_03735 [Kiritimatiellae bacterium]|nr:hypothetical protein [Kiritimatiellia bacterium]